MPRRILVSACLLGLNTRYNGEARSHPGLLDFLATRGILPIPVCPEQLGGLATPRPCTWFTAGTGRAVLDGRGELRNQEGLVMNDDFVRGAEEAWKVATLAGCTTALLKERSPSCGVHQVYLKEQVVPGCGVTAALLRKNHVRIFSEDELDRIAEKLDGKA